MIGNNQKNILGQGKLLYYYIIVAIVSDGILCKNDGVKVGYNPTKVQNRQ